MLKPCYASGKRQLLVSINGYFVVCVLVDEYY